MTIMPAFHQQINPPPPFTALGFDKARLSSPLLQPCAWASLGEEPGGSNRKAPQRSAAQGEGRGGERVEKGPLTIFGRVGSLGGGQDLAGRSAVMANLMQEVDGFPNKQDL